MKKSLLLTAVSLFAGITFGQKLKKGNVVGTHIQTIELKPGVTMEQFQELYIKLIPKYVKVLSGWKFYLTKGIRSENEGE